MDYPKFHRMISAICWRFSRQSVAWAFASFIVVIPLHGQESDTLDPTHRSKARRSGIRFVCTALPEGSPSELELILDSEGEKTVMVPLYRRKPGDYLPLPQGSEIKLGLTNGDSGFVVHAVGKKPSAARKLLAILVPNSSKSEKPATPGFRMHVIDESEFRLGDFYFINLTPLEFAVKFDGTQFKIGKYGRKRHEPAKLNEPRNSPVLIAFRPPEATSQTDWLPITRSTWRLRPTRKEICIFYWDEQSRRPAIKGLTIFEDTPAPAP